MRYDAAGAPFRWSSGCLSRLAECAQPETDKGRDFLRGVADGLVERVEYSEPSDTGDVDDLRDLSSEAADGAIPVYTHQKWAVFVDCGAYSENVSDLVHGKRDLTGNDVAKAALYQIADRLWHALAEEYEEKLEAEIKADEEADAAAEEKESTDAE